MWQHERDFIDRAVRDEPNAKRKNGTTALMTATKWNEQTHVKALMESGADVNAQNCFGWSALMMAAVHGRPEIVRLLLAKGADCSMRAKGRGTPLEAAKHLVMMPHLRGHAERLRVVELLENKPGHQQPNKALHPTPSPAFSGASSGGLCGRCRR